MLADTTAIRAFGDAHTRQSAVLDAVRTALAAAQPGADALGPAGAAFTRALADAVRMHAERVVQLGAVIADSGAAAHANAAAYLAADAQNGRSITGLGG